MTILPMTRAVTAAAAAFFALATFASPAAAGSPEVLAVEVSERGGQFTFAVTVAHADTGWDHYADAFTVHAPDGALLGTRTLFHPHVEEQPFTRSLTGVTVPPGITAVRVRAHDSVHGPGEFVDVPLPGR